MSPVIYSPVSPQGSLLDRSFDTMPFLQSSDSLCPLISSEDDTDHPSLFDSYIASMVEKDVRYSATDSTSDLSEGSRSSMDEGAMPLSPSQGTITQKSVRPRKLTTKRSIGEALKSLKPSSHGPHNRSKTSKHTPPALHLDETSFQTVDSEDLPGSIGMRREEEDAFDDRNRTVRRRNMPHHPFRYEDVPYMQAYSQILLEKYAFSGVVPHAWLNGISPVIIKLTDCSVGFALTAHRRSMTTARSRRRRYLISAAARASGFCTPRRCGGTMTRR